jgi:hypothetical protein
LVLGSKKWTALAVERQNGMDLLTPPDIKINLVEVEEEGNKKFNICLYILLDLNRVFPSVVPRAYK